MTTTTTIAQSTDIHIVIINIIVSITDITIFTIIIKITFRPIFNITIDIIKVRNIVNTDSCRATVVITDVSRYD